MPKLFVGVDVSKHYLDLYVSEIETHKRFANSSEGLDQLVEFLEPLAPELVVCEASGGYEKPLIQELLAAEIPVARANAARVRFFAKSMAQHAKTDKIDAFVIAHFAATAQLRALTPTSTTRTALREYYQHRSHLKGLQQRLRLSSNHHHFQNTADSAQRLLDALEQEIAEMDETINQLIEDDPELTEQAGLMATMKGIGVLTAASLLAYLPELGQVNNKEIAALAGLAPYANESGQWVGTRRCRGGRKEVRTALFMASVSATRYNPSLRAIHQRLIDRGKPKKVARVACMRKMLVWLNAMLRDGVPFSAEQAQGLV